MPCLELHRPLLVFLRRLGGNLRRSTRRELLLREFGVQPPARAWLRSAVQLWNRAADLPDTDLLAVAMRENASMSYPWHTNPVLKVDRNPPLDHG